MNIVDTITLMDYRDFSDTHGDGRTDGMIPRAQAFVADGNALGKTVVIGVEWMPHDHDHVTFFQECPSFMKGELDKVSRHFARDWAYRGIAIHLFFQAKPLGQEPTQPPAATRVAQSAQRLVLDLANALSREPELLSNLFEGVAFAVLQAKTQAQNPRLA